MKTDSIGRQEEVSKLTVRGIVKNSATMIQLSKVMKPAEIKTVLDLAITELSMSLNTKYNMNDLQVRDLVEFLYSTYKYDSLEDILYCFHMAKRGAYGTIYGLDAATVSQWLSVHLESKAAEREALAASAQTKPEKKYANRKEWLKDQPEWFQRSSRAEQDEVIEQLKKEWYQKGKEYLDKITAYRKRLKMGVQFADGNKEMAYRKFREDFIKEYHKKQQANDKAKTTDQGQQKRRGANKSDPKD